MKITVCIGTSCHMKGSKQVVEELQYLVTEHHLKDQVSLSGAFCMDNCQQGVCVTLDDVLYSVTPHTTKAFFETEVLPRLDVEKA